jgi:hypothetical protein
MEDEKLQSVCNLRKYQFSRMHAFVWEKAGREYATHRIHDNRRKAVDEAIQTMLEIEENSRLRCWSCEAGCELPLHNMQLTL